MITRNLFNTISKLILLLYRDETAESQRQECVVIHECEYYAGFRLAYK